MAMSKAFDTIDREKLLDMMYRILDPDEIHLAKILIEQVEYIVRVGNTMGESFKTSNGSPQGDGLSAIFFILYLAKALGYEEHLKDNTYTLPRYLGFELPRECQEHNYALSPIKTYELCKSSLNINTEYADDCGNIIISDNKILVNYLKSTIPRILKQYNLICNEQKNEEHIVNYENRKNGSWKTCKYLGTMLDSQKDFLRRKILTVEASKSLNDIWRSKLTINLKMKIFDCLVWKGKVTFIAETYIFSENRSLRSLKLHFSLLN